jgi:hypothetical protein
MQMQVQSILGMLLLVGRPFLRWIGGLRRLAASAGWSGSITGERERHCQHTTPPATNGP